MIEVADFSAVMPRMKAMVRQMNIIKAVQNASYSIRPKKSGVFYF